MEGVDNSIDNQGFGGKKSLRKNRTRLLTNSAKQEFREIHFGHNEDSVILAGLKLLIASPNSN